jgi:hypothetical protein
MSNAATGSSSSSPSPSARSVVRDIIALDADLDDFLIGHSELGLTDGADVSEALHRREEATASVLSKVIADDPELFLLYESRGYGRREEFYRRLRGEEQGQ